MRSIGGGYSDLEKILVLNMPEPVTKNNFDKLSNLKRNPAKVAEKNMAKLQHIFRKMMLMLRTLLTLFCWFQERILDSYGYFDATKSDCLPKVSKTKLKFTLTWILQKLFCCP